MLKYLWPASCLAVLISCGDGQKDQDGNPEKKGKETNEAAEVILPYDTFLTDMSRFIAGIETEKYFQDMQQTEYYVTHRKFTDTSWAKTKKNMMDPIKSWCKTNSITDRSDSSLCFYPLSGPDFLFGNAFFPHAQHYVLMGLEPNGSICDFRTLKPDQVIRYLSGIRESMAYLNKAGYFVTSHMSGDFTRAQLNGMLHMMLYMMARSGHTITGVDRVKIDSVGNVTAMAEGKIEQPSFAGIRIEFLSPDQKVKKSAYYFHLNARDKEIAKTPGFEKFVEHFGERVAYMKSASCVLVNTDFSVVRNLVLNSKKILQDDTGVPYHYFTEGNYNIQLFGQYTMTIKDLKWCFQPALKKAVAESKKSGPLPFRISYIGNYGEGMLLFATRKK